MRKLRAWLSGWGTYWHIRIFERERWHALTRPLDMDDFAFAESPGEILARVEGFTCPDCGMTSCNPEDIRYRYCGSCHQYK